MPKTLAAVAAGAAATLAAILSLTATVAQAATIAPAATITPAAVPAPDKSLIVAGYDQEGCQENSYPVYVEISGTITVPAATDIDGTPGISYDIYNLGGVGTGVSGGVAVDNSNGQAFYSAFGQWGTQPVTAFSVEPGDKLQVTIEDEGTEGWMVEIFDGTTGQEWTQWNPNSAEPCAAGAFEQSIYPSYDYLTRTTPVAFDFTRVWWGEQGQSVAKVSKLLGTLPAYAKLFRFNLVNQNGTSVATTSKPTDSNNNFTVTDAG